MVDIAPTRIAKGLARLIHAPSDLVRWDAHIGWKPRSSSSVAHRELFERYCAELAGAVREASDNWNGELHGWAAEEGRTPDQAKETMWKTYPAGPAAFPPFVALVRRYWLACDELNRQVPVEQAVRPEQFMLGWLNDESSHEELVAVLACMPYWPMGMDFEGNWI